MSTKKAAAAATNGKAKGNFVANASPNYSGPNSDASFPSHPSTTVSEAKIYGTVTSRAGEKKNGPEKEMKSKWGWGRPIPPKVSQEFFASEKFPWVMVYILDAVLSLGLTYMIFGMRLYAFLLFAPCMAAVLALPSLAAVMLPFTRYGSPAAKGNPEQYFTFVDKAFESQWKGQKIPMETLYEAYFAGLVDLKGDDLLSVLYERDSYARFIITFSHVKFFLFQLIPELLTHSRAQDVEQVREHYDRGDDFYAGFLGPTMIYTSGVFHTVEETLEEAQTNKMNLIANKIHMKAGDAHLDIGCGWGTFITHCAKNFGTDSIGVTLGLNQTAWANNISTAAGVNNRAKALCMDYRDIPLNTNNKKFDKITCLEMSEHVGVKYYSKFVAQVKDMLTDDGVFYLQIAGLRRPWQLEDFNWGLFMGKYVFPGADASCPLGWVIDKLEAGGFEIRSMETIGVHYSATIKRWYDNWQRAENKAYIVEKYGEAWFRKWQWFLAWSVISPEQGSATCYQIVAHKNTRSYDRKQWVAERTQYHI